MREYVSIEGLRLVDRDENRAQRPIMVKLANFIVQHKSDCISCVGDLSLLTVVPSNQVIDAYLNHVRASQNLLSFGRVQHDVRRAFISFIHEKNLWEQAVSSYNRSFTYLNLVTDSSWISHLPDDEVLRGLREKLNAAKT